MNLDRLRSETPGVQHRIHLNNAGAALPPRPVIEAVRDHLDLEARIGGYEARAQEAEAISAVYVALGRLVNAPAETIALTESATAAFNQAISSVPFRAGDTILTSRNDYASNQITYLSLQERFGVEILRAPDREEGGIDPMAAVELIHRRRPRLVSISQVPTNSGLVQELTPIGEACAEREILFLVDACQSVGQMPVDVDSLRCDFLSATSRKFLRGPRGMGFLYVSQRALDLGLEPLFIDMSGADWIAEDLYQPAPTAKRFELWERSYALALGMGAATRYALEIGLEAIRDRAGALATGLRAILPELGEGTGHDVRVLDRGPELCAIVTVAIAGRSPEDLVAALRRRAVNTSAIDRVSAVIDFDDKGVEGALRLSPHYYNTEDELDRAVWELGRVLAEE